LFYEPEFKAGGLFFPFIASLITSMARAKLHRLEHKYNALDASTDSIKTTMQPDEKDIGENLGQLQIKAVSYKTVFFRCKVYVMLDKNNNVIHEAHHGFHGTIDELLEMYRTQINRYKYRRMTKLKESKIQGLKPFIFRDCESAFNVDYGDNEIEKELKEMADLIDAGLSAQENKENTARHFRVF
jgi:ribosome-associated translation inhibitor RaiA